MDISVINTRWLKMRDDIGNPNWLQMQFHSLEHLYFLARFWGVYLAVQYCGRLDSAFFQTLHTLNFHPSGFQRSLHNHVS